MAACLRPSVLLLLGALVAAACGATPTPTATPLPTPTPTPTPRELLRDALERTLQAETFHFLLQTEGEPVFLDQGEQLRLEGAEGDAQRPDRVAATLQIAFLGSLVEIDFVAIGERRWITNPLSGAWQEAPEDWNLRPDALLRSETGLLAAARELESVELAGPDRFRGRLSGEDLARATSGLLVSDGPVVVEATLGDGSGRVTRLTLQAGQTTWLLTLSRFGRPVEITPPAQP